MSSTTLRSFVPLFALLVVALSGCDTTRWFLVAGQSNASGTSLQPTAPAEGLVWRVADRTLLTRVADPGLHFPDFPYNSAWPSFAAEAGSDTGLITSAVGGNCLLDWPHGEGGWDPLDGRLVDRAVSAWTDLGSPPLEAILWLQGECDANRARSLGVPADDLRALYRDALMALADRFAAEFGAVPLVAGQPSTRLCRFENVDCDPALFEEPLAWVQPVIDATLDAIALHPGIEPGPATSDLRMGSDEPGGTGSVHVWDVNALGGRWAEAVAALGP